MILRMIVAIDSERGIGVNGELPWIIPEDLKHFRERTLNTNVVMGRNTYESIPLKNRPLNNRFNIVITRDEELLKNTHKESNLRYVKELSDKDLQYENTYIIGGGEIYKRYISQTQTIILTQVKKKYNCDVFFPIMDTSFVLTRWSPLLRSVKEVDYEILEYERCNSMNLNENIYLKTTQDILNSELRENRTQVKTHGIFGTHIQWDMKQGFPLLTTKRVAFKTCVYELLWFLRGSTDNSWLKERNVHIWNKNSSREYLDSIQLNHLEEDDCGPCYGFQWRHYGEKYIDCKTQYQGIDQIENALNILKNDPMSRRNIIMAWNPRDVDKACLPPCHVMIQLYVNNIDGKNMLSGHMYQRSADWFLGEPFNVCSYAVLLHIMAKKSGMIPDTLIISTGDTHIYETHIQQMREQIHRIPLCRPQLELSERIKDCKWEELDITDFRLVGYQHHGDIKGDMVT